jgi:2-methylisocitrate lyase-like PEP mutase family enzyme
MKPSRPELYERFRALHEWPGGFIMPKPWDGASALLMKDAGFEALGTSAAAIALVASARVVETVRHRPPS